MDLEGALRRKTLRAGHRLLVVVLTAIVIWAVWQVRTVAIPILLGVFIASITIPPANRLVRQGMSRSLATTVVWLGMLAVISLLVLLLVPVTADGIGELRTNLDQFTVYLQEAAAKVGLGERRVADLTAQAKQWLSDESGRLAGEALTGVRTTGEIAIGAVLALVLGVYFTHGGSHLFGWLVDLAPVAARAPLRSGASVVFHVIGRYVRGVAVVGFVDGFFIGLALWILDVPLAIPLAVLTWIGAFLPIVGAFLAGLLAAIVAFVAKGWLVALIVVAVTIAIQQLEGHILAPQIYGRALDLPAAVILIAIALGSTLAGIAGAFLAAPLVSAAVALLQHRTVPSDQGS
ncbi:AI-2E family transporter [Actinocorallia sp. B10E7]|uniref:AI-2E family transporter n=1 Tax=Actinocorallia sp. B10E7 TaxID=3153558 RepID=UPI00325DEE61